MPNKIQQTIKEGLNIITEQKNQMIFDKLYKDYTSANSKYNMLDYKVSTQNAKSAASENVKKAANKEKKKIDILVKKMQSYPDLYKAYKPVIEYDVKAREHALNIYKLHQIETELKDNISAQQQLSNSIRAQKDFLYLTANDIKRLKSVAVHQPKEDALVKAKMDEEKKALLKEKSEAHSSIIKLEGNAPEAQKKLGEIETALRIHNYKYQEFLRFTPKEVDKNIQDHLEFKLAEVKAADDRIKDYENQIKQLTTGMTQLIEEQKKLKLKIAEVTSFRPEPVLPKQKTFAEKIKSLVRGSTAKPVVKETNSPTFTEAAKTFGENATLIQETNEKNKHPRSGAKVAIAAHRTPSSSHTNIR